MNNTYNLNTKKESLGTNIENIIKEFLSVIDFELYSINKDNINVQDIYSINEDNITVQDNNKSDKNINELTLPINFTSSDSLRVFQISKLTDDNYYINIANTLYPEVPFSKNGIESFNIYIRKETSQSKNREVFSSQLIHNDNLYITTIEKSLKKDIISYRLGTYDEFIDIDCWKQEDGRELIINTSSIPISNQKQIYITEKNINGKRQAVLLIRENHQEIYNQKLEDKEIEEYFCSLLHKIKYIIEQSNNGIKTLNNNIFNIVFNYYDISKELLNILQNSNNSNQIIENLFETYFYNTSLNTKTGTKTKKLTLKD